MFSKLLHKIIVDKVRIPHVFSTPSCKTSVLQIKILEILEGSHCNAYAQYTPYLLRMTWKCDDFKYADLSRT